MQQHGASKHSTSSSLECCSFCQVCTKDQLLSSQAALIGSACQQGGMPARTQSNSCLQLSSTIKPLARSWPQSPATLRLHTHNRRRCRSPSPCCCYLPLRAQGQPYEPPPARAAAAAPPRLETCRAVRSPWCPLLLLLRGAKPTGQAPAGRQQRIVRVGAGRQRAAAPPLSAGGGAAAAASGAGCRFLNRLYNKLRSLCRHCGRPTGTAQA